MSKSDNLAVRIYHELSDMKAETACDLLGHRMEVVEHEEPRTAVCSTRESQG